jgi:hypothetical protein
VWRLVKILRLLAIAESGVLAAAPEWNTIQPLIKARCYECHGEKKTKGDVDLKKLESDPMVGAEFALWEKVKDSVTEGEMPPPKAHQLEAVERSKLLVWVTQAIDEAALAQAGDPGPVTMRRLTNAEYDATIRDLTGVDFGFGKEFAPDGGGGEGFANTGDVLFLSAQALEKYLGAARKIADSATVMPGTGIRFVDHRVGIRGPDQVKAQAEQGLYVWYQKKAAPHLPKDDEDLREADYMLACWKWKHRELTGAESLAQLAKEMKLHQAFLENWWNLLNNTEPKSRFLDLTRIPWRELPGPDSANPQEAPAIVKKKLAQLDAERKIWYYKDPAKPGSGHVQRQQQDADGIRPYSIGVVCEGQKSVHLCIGDDGDGNKGDIVLVSQMQFKLGKQSISYVDFLRKQLKHDREVFGPAKDAHLETVEVGGPYGIKKLKLDELGRRIDEAEAFLAKLGQHPLGTHVEPDTLVIAAPRVVTLPVPDGAHDFKVTCKLDITTPDAELATVQWKLTTGPPPDVSKIMPGVLTVWKINTQAHHQTMHDFEQMRLAFPDEYVRRLEEVARNLNRGKPGFGVYYYSDEQLAAILGEDERREIEQMKKDWGYTAPGAGLDQKRGGEFDQCVRDHLRHFAKIAWRRPLADEENKNLDALYADGRARELDRESAAREVIVRILVSPNFLFKAETLPAIANETGDRSGTDVPLSAWEIASRMSYFIWSSMPDHELRQAAADGSLLNSVVRATQARRMLHDPKAMALAKEFFGQWFDFNTFASHTGVDDKLFPQFTPVLRQDLFEESVKFFSHLVREDRPVSEITGADYTFLNERLAKHYGIPDVAGGDMRLVKVDSFHRGGLLGMGSVLTKTSRPHRTSPVVRGNWLLQQVMGVAVPPPPPNVPKLNENGLKPTSMREMLSQHRADKACAVCHDRIDPLGFALENFDPIGRFVAQDENGTRIDDSAQYKDGTRFAGIDGLRQFLHDRQPLLDAQLCRKLTGYALGRQTLPTDKPLMKKMQEDLKGEGGKFSAGVVDIVNSRQFLNRRADKPMASN